MMLAPKLPTQSAERRRSAVPLVAVSGIVVRRQGRTMLDHVDLTVSAGEIVTIIGPNGAGKTTLVRVVLGLEQPSAGTVARRPGLTIGYAPQHLAPDAALPLDVATFLRLGGRADHGKLLACLDEVGLDDVLDQPVAALSGGERNRVLLARALLRDPDLLVLDEPMSGVDVNGQVELYRLIGDIRDRRGCGVLLVSHDLHLVMAATDRVLCLDGHVCCAGTPGDVARDPAFRHLFGEPVAAVLAVYPHRHDCAHETHVHHAPAIERQG